MKKVAVLLLLGLFSNICQAGLAGVRHWVTSAGPGNGLRIYS